MQLTLGVDVGGTKITAALVSFPRASIGERRRLPTSPHRGGSVVLDDVMHMASELLDVARASGDSVASIGLGICELVDNDGHIVSAATLDWRHLNVLPRLSTLAPATIEADVRAAALAEARHGAGASFDHFVYVTVGTGISACWVQDGKPWTGVHGATGTVGSSPMLRGVNALDGFGSTLEELAAGPALVAHYNRAAGPNVTSAEQVIAAAATGNAAAAGTVRAAALGLGGLIANLVNMLDPQAVVVGGGLGTCGGDYWTQAVEAARQHVWYKPSRSLPILVAGCGQDAGLIGAAAAAWSRSGRQRRQSGRTESTGDR